VFGSTKAVAFIRLYQRAAPAQVRGLCRFTPTCSEYAILAIEKYGLAVGSVRAFRRILRCRSPHGGIDEP
jgi:putative membrane protein insertion efficiency factor